MKSLRQVTLLLIAMLTAAAGNGITMVAFPWLVLQRNGTAIEVAIVAGAAQKNGLLFFWWSASCGRGPNRAM